ncbi:hypothetical protein [Campylobacter pinnipediorum]|uniref:hypothetical protein n=1 Tax=Campylobacter pinnipediorum TaxID=1965231 RepID=UPI00084DF0DE|nr:hypothetical protein [Campylobacter pinnipediorum]
MSEIKWLKWFFVSCLFCIIFVAVVNYTVDPFQQFRIADKGRIKFENSRYLSSGLTKNYKLNSVVVGTSMTENFLINEVQDILGYKNTIKLTMVGSVSKEQVAALNRAIKYQELNDVLWSLDIFAMSDVFNASRFPWDMYKDNNFMEITQKYLLNFYIFKYSLKGIRDLIRGYKNKHIVDFNCMYCSYYKHDENDSNLKEIVKSWYATGMHNNTNSHVIIFKDLKENFDKYWLTTIKENQNIRFKIFLPPYSILFFKKWESMNVIKDAFKFKEYALSELLKLKNVEIYDFQADKNITHNLNLYLDFEHYNYKMNTWMLKQMRDHKYLVTNENYKSLIEELKNQVKDYQLPDFITQENFKKE